MFSSPSLSSISLATVTPSLVMTGEPNFLSSTTFRPLGPRVIFTVSASWFTPRRIAWRDCSPKMISFAMSSKLLRRNRMCILPLCVLVSGGRLLQHDQDLFFAHAHAVIFVDL